MSLFKTTTDYGIVHPAHLCSYPCQIRGLIFQQCHNIVKRHAILTYRFLLSLFQKYNPANQAKHHDVGNETLMTSHQRRS